MSDFQNYIDVCELIGFDIDGTVIRTDEKQAVATTNFLAERGVKKQITARWVKKNIYHLNIPQRIALLEKKFGFWAGDKEKAFRSYENHLIDATRYGKVIPGTPETFEKLKRQSKTVAFITSASTEEAQKNIKLLEDAMGGERLKFPLVALEDVYDGGSRRETKPYWKPMAVAYEKAGCEPGLSSYVGDIEKDMQFVNSVNNHYGRRLCAACFVENTYRRSSLDKSIPVDFYFRNMQKMNKALRA